MEARDALELLPKSGMTGQGEVTTLSGKGPDTRAAGPAIREVVGRILLNATEVQKGDGPEAVVEVWGYDPLDWDGRVDRWSLVLDLYGIHDAEGDPRIYGAIDELEGREEADEWLW